MNKILTKIDWSVINDYKNRGLIIINQHPTKNLWILNYSKTCQFEQNWDDVTLSCRGLVIDFNGNIVARCFPKFFNLEELNKSEIPSGLDFEVFEKEDGSLGILFNYDNEWICATRGSFESNQALWMKNFLTGYEFNRYLNPNCTYLFEIIYDSNRVVVKYDVDDLVLLSVIITKTGEEMPYSKVVSLYNDGFSIVKKYDNLSVDINGLKDLEEENREGFVVRYSNGFRVKVKFKEYVRLHRILTNISTRSIWEVLKNGDGLDDIIDAVPDEFFQWVEKTKRDLLEGYMEIERDALKEFHRIYVVENKTIRKDFAMIAKDHKLFGLLFILYDGRTNYEDKIWKMLKPDYVLPFANNADNIEIKGLEI